MSANSFEANNKKFAYIQKYDAKENQPNQMNYSSSIISRPSKLMNIQKGANEIQKSRYLQSPNFSSQNQSYYSNLGREDLSQVKGAITSDQFKKENVKKENDLIIIRLTKQLQNQKKRYQQLQQKTIIDQNNVLNSLYFLEQKFKNLSRQKKDLIKQIQKLKRQAEENKKKNIVCSRPPLSQSHKPFIFKNSQAKQSHRMSDLIEKLRFQLCQNCFQKVSLILQQIQSLSKDHLLEIKQFKRVKGISKSLIDMMIKVQGLNPSEIRNTKANHIKHLEQQHQYLEQNYLQRNSLDKFSRQNNSEECQRSCNNQILKKGHRQIDQNKPINYDLKDAWRWIKKIVHEHQMIKTKAFKWKQIYDEVVKDSCSSQRDQNQSAQDKSDQNC